MKETVTVGKNHKRENLAAVRVLWRADGEYHSGAVQRTVPYVCDKDLTK